jgi:glycine/D-amino acid oxidase-like deaminating enzyme
MNNTGVQRVVIIGGGIVGVSIAAELASDHVEVTIVEKKQLGSGTTSTSYAWVNANGKEPESYYQINAAGIEGHRKLSADSGTWFAQSGHLEIAADASHEADLRRRAERLASHGYRVDEVSATQARELEPGLILPDSLRAAVHFPDEGFVYPTLYMADVAAKLRARGVTIRESAEVVAIDETTAGARVQISSGETFEADRVIIAAGRWGNEVAGLAGAEIPLASFSAPGDVTVGHLVRTSAVPVQLSGLVTTPWLNARPDGGGRLLVQALDLDVTADPQTVPGPDSALAQQYIERLRNVLVGAEGARVDEVLVGQRAMPADGKTIAGPVPQIPWLYAVATHSGVTLAPFLGRAVADEVLGVQEPLLEDFRLERFAQGVPSAPPAGPRKPGEQ